MRKGKLVGFHRKKNDALLMFYLRHYGQDANGKRTTINYFSTRATAAATAGSDSPTPCPSREREGSLAVSSTTTVRTVISGGGPRADGEAAARVLEGFEGVALDDEAHEAITAALEACAARARAARGGCRRISGGPGRARSGRALPRPPPQRH